MKKYYVFHTVFLTFRELAVECQECGIQYQQESSEPQ